MRPVPTAPSPKSPEVARIQPAPTGREEDLTVSDPRLAAAKEALQRKDCSEALRLCETARKQGAAQPAVLELQAALFKETGYLDREIAALRRWIELVPQDAHPWIKLFY